MKNCTNIEQDVPYSIPEAPGADSGAKRPKNQKNVTRKFSEKIWKKTKKRARAVCSIGRRSKTGLLDWTLPLFDPRFDPRWAYYF